MSKSDNTPNADYSHFSKARAEFEQEVDTLLTDEGERLAREYLSCPDPIVRTVTPEISAAIHRFHNSHNRDFSVNKASKYSEVMKRGEWRQNHQGFASYPDSSLGDGQHRNGGVILCRLPQQFMFSRIERDAGMTIDLSAGRTVGDALKLEGVDNANFIASISKNAMECRALGEFNVKPQYTVIQRRDWVMEHLAVINKAAQLGIDSLKGISDPAMNKNEAATTALLMLLGGHPNPTVEDFLRVIQTGTGTYDDCPTVMLTRKLIASRNAKKGPAKLTALQKWAYIGKCVELWAKEARVARLVWTKDESFPKFQPPVEGGEDE